MVIKKLVITDENDVEHVVEGPGWFRIWNEVYRGQDAIFHAEAHISLTDKKQVTDRMLKN